MIDSLDASAQRFLDTLGQTGRRMSRAQMEVSSGLRVRSASDDADNIGPLLELRAELESTRQANVNLGRIKAEVDTAEQVLQNAVGLVERAAVLGAQGVSGTASAETRRSISAEVEAILEQLTGIAATMVEGRYIFSGDADQNVPYDVDLTQAHGVTTYNGTAATRRALHPNGTSFAVARTAEEIFDDPNGSSVFAAVNSLRAALESDDTASIRTALDALATGSEYLNGQLSFYGAVQNRVAEATDFGSKAETRVASEISAIESADITAAILEMTEARYQQEASLASWAKMPRTSLFDYLR